MDSGGAPGTSIELPQRISLWRSWLDNWRFPTPRRNQLNYAAGCAVWFLLVGVPHGPLGAAVGAAVGGSFGLVGFPLIVLHRIHRRAGVVRWQFSAAGLTMSGGGSGRETPWRAVDALVMTDSSTTVLFEGNRTVLRTETAVPTERRAVIEQWRQAVGTGEAMAPPAPTAPDPGSPDAFVVRAVITPEDCQHAVASPRSGTSGCVDRVLQVVVILGVPGWTAMALSGRRAFIGFLPGIVILALLSTYTLVPRMQSWSTASFHRQVERFWGQGPVSWIVDPHGFEQSGSSGRRVRTAWSSVPRVDVDDTVVKLRSNRYVLASIIPVRAFDDGQLARLLSWYEASGGSGVRRSTVRITTTPRLTPGTAGPGTERDGDAG